MAELTFYTNPQSRARIVRWMLEEVGAPYDTHFVGYEEMKGADYLAVNPMGKVPAIFHAGRVVTECAAICAYLADAFPEAGLAPPPAERHDYYRWLFYAAGPVEQAAIDRARKIEVSADQSRMVGYGSFDQVIDTLAQCRARLCHGRSLHRRRRLPRLAPALGLAVRLAAATRHLRPLHGPPARTPRLPPRQRKGRGAGQGAGLMKAS